MHKDCNRGTTEDACAEKKRCIYVLLLLCMASLVVSQFSKSVERLKARQSRQNQVIPGLFRVKIRYVRCRSGQIAGGSWRV